MFDGFGKAFGMLGGMDGGGLVFLAALVVVIGLIFYIKWGMKRAHVKDSLEIYEATHKYEKEKVAQAKEAGKEIKESILGTGDYQCVCIKQGQIIDWTTIPAPIGELYQADISCPMNGGIYIVQELESGEIVDYDPRDVEVKVKETPEWAWSSTHCKDIVNNFWCVQTQWWKSISVWYAAGVLVIVFLMGMALVGG